MTALVFQYTVKEKKDNLLIAEKSIQRNSDGIISALYIKRYDKRCIITVL